VRSFIAVDPSEEVIGHLIDAIDRMRQGSGGIRWLREDQIHLTLKFLGSVDEEILSDKIYPRLTQLAQASLPIKLQVRGIGFFPSPDRPRVVWAGIEGQVESLKALQERIEASVQAFSGSCEDRTFRPHLTLGRVREPHKRYGIGRMMMLGETVEFGAFMADRLILYKSELTPGGARYTKLSTFKLGREKP